MMLRGASGWIERVVGSAAVVGAARPLMHLAALNSANVGLAPWTAPIRPSSR